jgi:hypothetical protein
VWGQQDTRGSAASLRVQAGVAVRLRTVGWGHLGAYGDTAFPAPAGNSRRESLSEWARKICGVTVRTQRGNAP